MIKNLHVNPAKHISLNKKNFHTVISQLKKVLQFQINSLDINIVNKEYILELNKNFLNHNYTTDIITFNYSEDNVGLDGEIFISLHDAINNAKRFGVSLDTEILRLIIHGVLHLVGYDDISSDKKRIMKRKENKLVELFKNQNLVFIKKKYD
ncbi:MAG: rRNA maturation RNase YbeY [Ignavibacteriae bacterium]|nr:rRNA maturation RNase YbeY [Ignavibacteriota bacterium]NOG96577.1 rRNA maturation RNase YbeY [Ignavibacteriota bacterium]